MDRGGNGHLNDADDIKNYIISEGTPCVMINGILRANDAYAKFIRTPIQILRLSDLPGITNKLLFTFNNSLNIHKIEDVINEFELRHDKTVFIDWLREDANIEYKQAYEIYAAIRDYIQLKDSP